MIVHVAFGDGEKIIVLDSGGGHLRAGPANGSAPAAMEPNCSAVPKERGERQLAFGCDVHDLPAYRLHRPTQRGLLLDPEQQKIIWKAALLRDNSLMLGPAQTIELVLGDTFLASWPAQPIGPVSGDILGGLAGATYRACLGENISGGLTGATCRACLRGHISGCLVGATYIGAVLQNSLLAMLAKCL